MLLIFLTGLVACEEDEFEKASVGFYSENPNARTGITLAEDNGASEEVTVRVSYPITVDSKVIISVSDPSAVQTTPSLSAFTGNLELNIPAGEVSASFSFQVVNDDEANGDREISFTITGYTGDIKSVAVPVYGLQIIDDDIPPTIMALRSRYDERGERTDVNDPTFTFTAIVTSDRSTANLNASAAFIQDETGGIGVFVSGGTFDYDLGDSIQITAGPDVYIDVFNELVQLYLPAGNIQKLGEGTLPEPIDISYVDFLNFKHQGELVRFTNCEFQGGGSGGFGGTSFINTPDGSIQTFVRNSATFAGETMPAGKVTVTGIAGRFFETAQITLRSPELDIIPE